MHELTKISNGLYRMYIYYKLLALNEQISDGMLPQSWGKVISGQVEGLSRYHFSPALRKHTIDICSFSANNILSSFTVILSFILISAQMDKYHMISVQMDKYHFK